MSEETFGESGDRNDQYGSGEDQSGGGFGGGDSGGEEGGGFGRD